MLLGEYWLFVRNIVMRVVTVRVLTICNRMYEDVGVGDILIMEGVWVLWTVGVEEVCCVVVRRFR